MNMVQYNTGNIVCSFSREEIYCLVQMPSLRQQVNYFFLLFFLRVMISIYKADHKIFLENLVASEKNTPRKLKAEPFILLQCLKEGTLLYISILYLTIYPFELLFH